jgi:hypothetical protein
VRMRRLDDAEHHRPESYMARLEFNSAATTEVKS